MGSAVAKAKKKKAYGPVDGSDVRKSSSKKEDEGVKAPWWRDILEVAVTLAVIIIVLQLLFGAHMTVPLVAVVSCSMLHQDDIIGSVSQGISQILWPILLDGPAHMRPAADGGNG